MLYGDAITPQRGLFTEWGSEAKRDTADYEDHVKQLTESIRAIVATRKQQRDKIVAAYLAQSPSELTKYAFKVGQPCAGFVPDACTL